MSEHWHVETDAEEAARMTKGFLKSHTIARIVALETVYAIKGELDETPRWQIVRRFNLVRAGKRLVKKHDLGS